MKIDELRALLVAEKFRPSCYSLDKDDPDPNDALCLRFEHGFWVVYYTERGYRTFTERFSTQDAAGDYLLAELRRDPTTRLGYRSPLPPPPLKTPKGFKSPRILHSPSKEETGTK
jgi:hypothetical protein